VERKGMNKWFMKLFRRLLSATVLSSLIIWGIEGQSGVSHIFGENEFSIGRAYRNSYLLHGIVV
jgi:hypothetical protein